MVSLNNDIDDIIKQYKISEEDEITFNKLRDEVSSLCQQFVALAEHRTSDIEKMQAIFDKYKVDQTIVTNFINNVGKHSKNNNDAKIIIDETEPVNTKKTTKKKTTKKSGAAPSIVEDEIDESEKEKTNKEQETNEEEEEQDDNEESNPKSKKAPIKKRAVRKTTKETEKKAPAKKTPTKRATKKTA